MTGSSQSISAGEYTPLTPGTVNSSLVSYRNRWQRYWVARWLIRTLLPLPVRPATKTRSVQRMPLVGGLGPELMDLLERSVHLLGLARQLGLELAPAPALGLETQQGFVAGLLEQPERERDAGEREQHCG